jgi:hypothetical protein
MYEKLVEAAKVAGSVTFLNGKSQEDQIRHLSFKVAKEFDKTFELNLSGHDVTVSFR